MVIASSTVLSAPSPPRASSILVGMIVKRLPLRVVVAAALATALIGAAPSVPPWGFDLAGMDGSIHPGDDFVRFSGGEWMRTTAIPPDRSAWGPFAMLRASAEADVKAIVDDI